MSSIPFEPPVYGNDAFNCPECHAYANMDWANAVASWNLRPGSTEVSAVDFARCSRCRFFSVWYEEELIFPSEISVDEPNSDLPEEVLKDYLEAASILQKSPRGAAALLRLAIQKLCNSLVEGNEDLNTKIGSLVANGLDSRIQKALDIVRVVGNEAVHPGQIDLNDTPETANQLFKMVNLITQRMITEPKEIEDMYQALPPEKIKGIEKRDKKEM